MRRSIGLLWYTVSFLTNHFILNATIIGVGVTVRIILSRLSKLFVIPTFTEEATSPAVARPLYITLGVLFIASLSLGVWGILRNGELTGGKVISFVLSVPFGLLFWAMSRGHIKPVRLLIPVLLWATLTASIMLDDGIRAVDTVGFALVLVLAGMFIGAQAVWGFGVLCLTSVTAVYLAELNGWVQTSYGVMVQIDDLTILIVILLLVIFVTYYAINFLEQSTLQARNDARLLALRNQELRDVQTSLQARTAELAGLNTQLRAEIQERQQIEHALRQSEGMNRAILDYMPDMILRIDKNGVFQEYSPSRNMLPIVSPEFFIGKSMVEIMPPHVAEPGTQAIRQAIATNEMQFFEYALPGDDGGEHIYESRNIPIGNDEVITIVRDITDERHAEQAALQTQKLESIGLLAGGIAHDFNNLLTGMLGQNSLALAKLPPDSPARRHLERAVVSAKRAADLTRQLLAYAGKGQFLVEPIDLNQLVHEGTGLLETVLPKQAVLTLDLMPSLPTVEADRGQIQQVLMNLVINASEALGGQAGTVKIRTYVRWVTNEMHSNDHVLPEAIVPGRYVCLEVQDTGRGMDMAEQRRIFDPYYSTKGQGRGLGLSATLGIIRSYHGYLVLNSVQGVGTRFQIYWPAGQVINPVLETAVDRTVPHEGTILIIDDEESVRQAAGEILGLFGYDVLTAADGLSGIDLYQQRQDAVDLVLLDMHMPIMNGTETFASLRRIQPTVSVLFSSGFTELSASEILQGDRVDFLQKPYDVDKLITKVQQMLAGATAKSGGS